MDIKKLKILAGEFITTSELSNPAKIQMLNFIQKEATDIHLKSLILNGSIDILDEQKEKEINEKWKLSEAGGKIAQARKSFSSTALHGAYGLWNLYRVIRSKYDQCTKHCGVHEINTARRQYCMIKCKVTKLEQQLQTAQKAKHEKEISKLKVQLAKAKNTMAKYIDSFKGQDIEL